MATVEFDPQGATEIVSLDDVLASEPAINVIKIDVEGWELDVLRGSAAILARHRPVLYIEIMADQFDAVCRYLDAAGYHCWKRFNVTPTFLFLPHERLVGRSGDALRPIPGNVQV